MRRAVATVATSLVAFALLAPAALANADHGEGLYGETGDTQPQWFVHGLSA